LDYLECKVEPMFPPNGTKCGQFFGICLGYAVLRILGMHNLQTVKIRLGVWRTHDL
jgi:hypothetical protein